jgi:hypothetical protein
MFPSVHTQNYASISSFSKAACTLFFRNTAGGKSCISDLNTKSFFEKNTAARFFYLCAEHYHCHGVPLPLQAPIYCLLLLQRPTLQVHTSAYSSASPEFEVQLTSTSQCKGSFHMSLLWTALKCLYVCPTQKNVSSAGAHFTNTHAPRSSYQKDEQFPLQDKSSNKFSDAA